MRSVYLLPLIFLGLTGCVVHESVPPTTTTTYVTPAPVTTVTPAPVYVSPPTATVITP
jgi:hypothetical protein